MEIVALFYISDIIVAIPVIKIHDRHDLMFF
jgi:hypothetical protein